MNFFNFVQSGVYNKREVNSSLYFVTEKNAEMYN